MTTIDRIEKMENDIKEFEALDSKNIWDFQIFSDKVSKFWLLTAEGEWMKYVIKELYSSIINIIEQVEYDIETEKEETDITEEEELFYIRLLLFKSTLTRFKEQKKREENKK